MTAESEQTVAKEPEDSIFAREQLGTSDEPWWQRNFLLTKPVLFGTWDGVFTTVMVNIFGIIVFLRMGWIVGTAGIAHAIVLLIICTTLALIAVFSAIGICERCQIQSGGIYFLISHVLGGQIGGAVGLLYAFGQFRNTPGAIAQIIIPEAVATGLVSIGFGESVSRLIGTENPSIDKLIAISTLLALTGINLAGVRWIIRLQLLLLGFLALAVIDFYLGALFNADPDAGVGRFATERFDQNIKPMYDGFNCSSLGFDTKRSHQNFFTVFGVFFANFLGVLAGVNMSDDIRNPRLNIPLGEISAIAVSSLITFSFILILGAMVDRPYLLCDSMIAEKVSLSGFLFLTGLYLSSLSSTVGSMIGTPRVIQSIASEGVIPILNPLSVGHGPNKSPLRATAVMMLIAIIFVLISDLNQLATLSTMPFLITYAFVNYSHVSLEMSRDLETVHKLSIANTGSKSYGSIGNLKETAAKQEQGTSDLEQLFSERGAKSDSSGGCVQIAPREDDITYWYSSLSNRYISFVGAIVNILILLFVNVWYALIHLMALVALYLYIGRSCPSIFPGISQFSLSHMFKTVFSNAEALGVSSISDVIIPKDCKGMSTTKPDLETQETVITEDNPDYQDRKRYHHTEKADHLHDID